MSIAIVGVTEYIENSRLKTYVSTANEYVSIVSTEIAKQNFVIRDENTVYYIHINNLKTEDGGSKSPFGDWVDAYVVVVINPETGNYEYYWTSVDDAGYRIDVTEDEELKVGSIYVSSDLTINPSYPIGGRDYVTVYQADGTKISTEPEVELDEEEAESCFTYIVEDTGIAITGYDVAACGTDVVIPSFIDGVNVYRIGEGAFRNKKITNLTIYKGVQIIGYGAFQGNKLNTVKLAISVKTVGDYAFYKSNISTLIMSEGVQTIGVYAFANNNICSVSLPASLTSIGTYAFANNCLTSINLPAGVSVSGGTFAGNDISDSSAFIYKKKSDGSADYSTIVGYAGNKVDNITIPATKNGVALTTIGSNAFSSVGLVGHIEIPETVTYIGGDAFAFNKLTSLTLHEGLKTISTGAFRSNYLTEINIPNSVTSIGNYPFNLNSVEGEAALTYGVKTTGGTDYSKIVGYAGGRVNSTITIPIEVNGTKLLNITSNAFTDSNLTAVYLPSLSEIVPNGSYKGLTIENNAFVRNKIPASFMSEYGNGGFFYKVTNGAIDYSCLSSYGGIQSGVSSTITIPDAMNDVPLKTIAAGFTWMSYKKIVIPATVTTINNGVFAKSARNNPNLVTIVNKTGKEWAWNKITSSSTSTNNTFETGTIIHEAGNITVTSE